MAIFAPPFKRPQLRLREGCRVFAGPGISGESLATLFSTSEPTAGFAPPSTSQGRSCLEDLAFSSGRNALNFGRFSCFG